MEHAFGSFYEGEIHFVKISYNAILLSPFASLIY